ncbi:serine/threonine-protein kinase LMTK1 isoform X2 [Brachyhypopomus gauderio]
MSTLASPASASGTDVYILPLTEVSLPGGKQPARSVQLLKSTDACRHSLMCIKEIGQGWFGKVLMGELNSGHSSTQVVVKELKTSANVHEQMRFLEEAQPYRCLQHSALLQCVAQCTEVSPYLLIMELCPLGDVKGYLRSCRVADSVTPDPLLLQRMACQIASGLLHLHKHDYTHSDLALRNCLLTSDLTVKIGDYGLSQNKYKDDYFVTSDQSQVPLRWIAPELVDEVHGNVLVVDQTKQSNIWSLGVTIWELFELGNQPYRHYSDRQVLSYAVKDQQLKLPKPVLQFPLADRWYEVMQFCWLQPDQRPNAEEVHLLLSYLCAKGASEAEEDFERRWNSMRPNMNHSSLHRAGPLAFNMNHSSLHRAGSMALNMPQTSTTSSSFPLLEQFSAGDGYQSGDDILTVTETSHGLNFEYKWEQARVKQPYHSSTGTLGQGNPHCQDIYYPPGGMVGGCGIDGLTLGVSPQYYEAKQLHTPGVVPVLNAHSTSVSSEYYIRIEEPVECSGDLEYPMCAYSPDFGGSSGSFLTASGDSAECMNCPSEGKPIGPYWSADVHKSGAYDSDSSPAMSLTMEPLLGQISDDSPLRPWESGHYVSYKDRDGGYYYEPSPPLGMEHYLFGDPSEPQRESWGSRSLRQALGELDDPLGISPSLGSPPQGYRDPYIENSQGSVIGKNVAGGYYDMMGSLRKTMPGNHSVCIDIESGGAVFVGQDDSESEEEDLIVERQAKSWAGSHSTKNTLSLTRRQGLTRQDAYADFHYTMPMTDVEDTWPKEHSLPYRPAKQLNYLDSAAKCNTCPVHGRHASVSSADCGSHSHLCHKPREAEVYPVPCCQALSNSHFVDPLTGSLVRNSFMNDNVSEKNTSLTNGDQQPNQPALSIGRVISKTEATTASVKQTEHLEYVDFAVKEGIPRQEGSIQQDTEQTELKTEIVTVIQKLEKPLAEHTSPEPESDVSRAVDSGVERGPSSLSLVEIDDCSDEDFTDVTSGIFGDFPGDYAETVDCTNPTFKSLQKQVGTPDSMDSIDLPSTVGSSETLSPASVHPSSSPRAMDSGYDTENNESPEFVPKEPHESQDAKAFIKPLEVPLSDPPSLTEARDQDGAIVVPPQEDIEVSVALTTSQNNDMGLTALSDKTPYRDSAYFSDCETGKDVVEKTEKDTDNLEMRREGSIEMIAKEDLISTQEEEQDHQKSHVVETNENGGHIHDNTEEQAENLVLEEVESICLSTSEITTIPYSSVEVAECPENKVVQDELDSDCSQDVSCECESLDFTSLPFSDATKETSKPEETDSILSLEPLTTSADSNVKNTINAFNKPDEPQTENQVTEDVISITCSKEQMSQDGTDVVSVANAVRSVSMDTLADKSEAPDSNTEEKVQGTKGSSRPSSPPPVPPLEGRTSPTDGEEADEEDGDSEDSDESDEELRTYRIQEQSEESDDEVLPVPIVVSDCSHAHTLRSSLKIPSLLPDSLCDDLECKKKVVSFFDDVTVYLFDQESPTRELAEHSLLLGEEANTENTTVSVPNHQERVSTSDDSSDGNISEESTALEWEDDFTLLPLPTSVKASPQDVGAKSNPPHPTSVEGSPPDIGAKSNPPHPTSVKASPQDVGAKSNPPHPTSVERSPPDVGAKSNPPHPTSVKGSPPDVGAQPNMPPSATSSRPTGQFSRFTVSPSIGSRFSITHVSDSDIDSAGGSSEDGERE